MFFTQTDVDWVMNKVWCMAGIPVDLKPWSLLFDAKREVVDKELIWVRIPGYPMEYWTEG